MLDRQVRRCLRKLNEPPDRNRPVAVVAEPRCRSTSEQAKTSARWYVPIVGQTPIVIVRSRFPTDLIAIPRCTAHAVGKIPSESATNL